VSDLAQEVSRRKRRFDEGFKRGAVRLVVEDGYALKAAAAAAGVSNQSLRAWPAKCAPSEPCGDNATVDELRANKIQNPLTILFQLGRYHILAQCNRSLPRIILTGRGMISL